MHKTITSKLTEITPHILYELSNLANHRDNLGDIIDSDFFFFKTRDKELNSLLER